MDASELAELDAAVARALGEELRLIDGKWMAKGNRVVRWYYIAKYSTDWSQGGPIIERERIMLMPFADGSYSADIGTVGHPMCGDPMPDGSGRQGYGHGPTPLIAAMRAFVESKK